MPDRPKYPQPPRSHQDPVTDVMHQETIVDPFRWLEDSTSSETRDWIAVQNGYVDHVLAGREEVAAFAEALRQILMDGISYSAAHAAPGRVFFQRHTAEESQPKLCVAENGGESPERVLIDPGTDPTGLTALDWYHVSPDGGRVVYGLSHGGTEESVLHVAEVESGRVLQGEIEHTRFCSLAWLKDGSGFYYTRHPHPGEVPPGEEVYHNHVFLHRIGTDPKDDPKIFGEGRPMKERPQVRLDDGGKFLWIMAGDGWRRTTVFRLAVGPGSASPELVLDGFDATFDLDFADGLPLFLTNHGAPNYRIVRVDAENPQESNWQDVVPGSADLVVRDFVASGSRILVHVLKDVSAHAFILDVVTGQRVDVSLPGHGSISEVAKGPAGDFMLTYDSFLQAPTIYRVDPLMGSLSPLRQSTTSADAKDVTVRQVFYTSKDGTRVPMYIVHLEGIGRGPHPTVLTGYGGFNIVRSSEWSPRVLPWVLKGGVYALANLRGGGEYGDAWHRAGMLSQKQNVYDDFFAAAEYLIAEGITDREHLGAFGRSNGGLLMGACLTQRPELFGAIVCGVPLLDMLRYDRFLIGALWTTEYGTPANPEDFSWLYAYSPYQRVRGGVNYPPTYFFAAMDDSRVDALHARKMTALMQETSPHDGSACIMMRTEFGAGHGVGKPIAAVVEEHSEMWGFFAWQLGLKN